MEKDKKTPLAKSFFFAFRGIFSVLRKERNFKIHLTASLVVVLLGLYLGLSRLEWLVITTIVFVILAAEIFNSALEGICDLLKSKLKLGYEETAFIRNASAGAVLVLAIASIILALIIFWPYIF